MKKTKGYIHLGAILIVAFFLVAGYFAYFKYLEPLIVQKTKATVTKPNIIMIMTDDQDYFNDMAKMTKTNQLLGGSGTTFSNSFVSNSLCCPSRSTFLTGQYAHNHGVWNVVPPNGGYGVFKTKGLDNNNLAVWLKNAGYTTVHIGKYLNGYGIDNPATEVPPGWSEWYGSVDPSTYQYYGFTVNENGNLVTYTDDGSGTNYSTDVYTNKAIDFIGRHAADSSSFFMNLAFNSPHSDNLNNLNDMTGPTPAKRHIGLYANETAPQRPNFNEADVSDKPSYVKNLPLMDSTTINAVTTHYRNRLEALQSVDEDVEKIYNALVANGKLDNTMIIFTSDNGYFHGEHRITNGKVHVYEESIRVPLIIKGPGIPTQTIDKMVVNLDFAPTIVEWAGATPGLVMDGLSLVPLLQNPTISWRSNFLLEGIDQSYFAGRGLSGVYSERSTGEIEAYNLTSDPYQLVASKTFSQTYHDIIAQLKVCSGASCQIAAPTPTPTPTPTPAPTPTPVPTATPGPDITPPTVSITFPTNGSSVSRNSFITIKATASDNIGVKKVEFYVGTSLTCTDTTYQYTCSWHVPNVSGATYNLTARAYDAAGNKTTSSIVTVTTNVSSKF